MDIIDEAVSIGRFIIEDEKHPTKLYKVCKYFGTDLSDNQILQKLNKHFTMEQIKEHFEFWYPISDKEQSLACLEFVDIDEFKLHIDEDFYFFKNEVFETFKRGIDFGKLYRYDDCNHGKYQNKPCLGFQPTPSFWKRFLLHIIKSLEMLSVVGVVHHDVFMRNIIIDHFESEQTITNPILIDFGESETSDSAEKENAKSFHLFLKYCYCCNPMRDTNWIFGNVPVPYDAFPNLTEATNWVVTNF
jgi:hypothetical protein